MSGADEPHPRLHAYHDAHDRRAFVRALFDGTATEYDRINRLFSLGSGGRYRRQVLLRTGLAPGMQLVDVAVGTGLLANEAVRLVGDPGAVIGIDPSGEMLREARRKLSISLIQGRAEHLPLADGCADFLTMGYALRHVEHLSAAFAEFARVLRPGGTLLILEFVAPSGRVGRALTRFYLGAAIPALCRLLAPSAQTETLMRYCWDTVEASASPDTIQAELAASGFTRITAMRSLGFLIAYCARKSATGDHVSS
jgi:demethylmenaquinone methyltransferase/2-methoxy-6-polyprenyl-1,4-benzoquinol methylase